MRFHKVVDLFPPMSKVERENLKRDIEAKGLKTPVWIWKGMVIDGRNRLECCEELGLNEFEIEEFEGTEQEMVEHVMSLNMSRRQLNSGQKACIGVELGVYRGNLEDGKSGDTDKRLIERIAEELGTNRQYLYAAEKLREKQPELFSLVRLGEMSLSAASKALKKLEAGEQDDSDDSSEGSQKPGQPASDASGNEVPDDLKKHFEARESFLFLVAQLKTCKAAVEELAAKKAGTAFLDVPEITAYLSSAMAGLKAAMPHEVCPHCDGSGCGACKDTGYVNSMIAEMAPTSEEVPF